MSCATGCIFGMKVTKTGLDGIKGLMSAIVTVAFEDIGVGAHAPALFS
jgi:hypothetical protein